MRVIALFPLVALAAACGGEGGSSAAGGVQSVERDSSGVAIVEYPSGAWDRATEWVISDAPVAVIGDESPDATLDLSTAALGGMLSDGRVVVATAQPAQVFLFNADGTPGGTLGRQGEGPGEYRFLQHVLVIPGDTIVAFEVVRRKGLYFGPDGAFAREIDFPVPGDRPIPPLMRGRLADGTFIHSGEQMLPQSPGGPDKVFRMDLPVFAFPAGSDDYDTITVTKSAQMYASSISAGGQTMPMARPVAFGPTPLIVATGATTWISTGDVAELRGYTFTGGDSATAATTALSRIVRFSVAPREVAESDRERYKSEAKAALEQFRAMMPPGMLESEIAKVDETLFASTFPAIGQMVVDAAGRLWLGSGAPFGDSLRQWVVLDASGKLLGRVTLPEGNLVAASTDRVVVRRENEETGIVRLEVWGLNGEQRTEN